MNEFNAQTGGRYVYAEDVLNLQELALAFGHIFDECDSFIVSGCEVSGSSISAGYIYLNGKLRRFSGASGISKWPQYLYEKNTTDSVNYVNGGAQIGRTIYGVSIGSSVPTAKDEITGKFPVSLRISQSGGRLMKDAFFGKYALVLNPENLVQVINSSVKVNGDLEISGLLKSVNNIVNISNAGSTCELSFVDGGFTASTKFNSSSNSYKLSVNDNTGFVATINEVEVATIAKDGISLPDKVKAANGLLGNVRINANNIYNYSESTDTAALNINMLSSDGDVKYYRNTCIGDGKGVAIVTINGMDKTASVAGVLDISGSSTDGIVFSFDKKKDSTGLQKSIVWKDSDKAEMGVVGFAESEGMSFSIKNNLASVSIYGATNSFVDLGPAIKENGKLLSDKYVLKSTYDADMSTVAKSEDVFDKTNSDSRYAQLSNGFSDYVSSGKTKEELREQIEAVGESYLLDYTKKSELLSDIATSDDAKRQIRNNIGAAGASEVQLKLKDSGWINIKEGLYIRQIGNIVSIQGTITLIHTGKGSLFTIPNDIDPPKFTLDKNIVYINNVVYRAYIPGGNRECIVEYCGGCHGIAFGFSLTYMV